MMNLNSPSVQRMLPLIAFFALTLIQIAVGVVYRLSQNAGGSYSYAPTSAIALAEFIKICMSFAFVFTSDAKGSLPSAFLSYRKNLNSRLAMQLLG